MHEFATLHRDWKLATLHRDWRGRTRTLKLQFFMRIEAKFANLHRDWRLSNARTPSKVAF